MNTHCLYLLDYPFSVYKESIETFGEIPTPRIFYVFYVNYVVKENASKTKLPITSLKYH